jgi:CAAX protease family protein
MTATPDPGPAPVPYPSAIAPEHKTSAAEEIFKGPNGLRAGWRLLIFLVLFLAVALGLQFVLHHIPALHAWEQAQPKNQMTPGVMVLGEGVAAFSLFLAAFFMTLIEKRNFADYYLPPQQAFGKRFWQGVPYGFAMVSLLIAVIAAFRGFSIEGMALEGGAIVKYGLLYALVFFLVGFFEEFSFRGYMQSTLGSGIGFWPAAIILSILFGAIHLGNTGEAWFGALMAGSFGFLAAFALSRTGNIWFPLGIHAAWDWGETYFYSVPDSGFMAQGHLLNSTFHGPTWLTGGSVGPEGSVFALLVLVVGGIGIHFLFPVKQVTD